MIDIFIHGKENSPWMFQRLLDQAGYYNCSLYKTGKVCCRELISGGLESVSNEEECPWFSNEKKRVRSYRVAAI
ncbi:MAG TPA: hypothetical protein PKZ57_01935 [Methanoregulaceae archaeon]|nr:hypothetical protein [Methanoregulaceae archaeon]